MHIRYPKFYRKITNILGLLSGWLVFIVAALAVYEIIMRGVFNRPTGWSMDISTYLLLWIIFTGVSYSLEVKGQVAVDIVRSFFKKRNNKPGLKISTVMGYLVGLIVSVVFLYNGYSMSRLALRYNRLTPSAVQIPQVLLTSAILLGGIMMIITIVFIILDVIDGGEEFT